MALFAVLAAPALDLGGIEIHELDHVVKEASGSHMNDREAQESHVHRYKKTNLVKYSVSNGQNN